MRDRDRTPTVAVNVNPSTSGSPSATGGHIRNVGCVEPLDTWVMIDDGKAVQTSSFDLVDDKKQALARNNCS
jgi:hypothetical protein